MYDVGLLGGGQLGRMLLQRGIDYGLRFKVLDAQPDCPCAWMATAFVSGNLQDYDIVYSFARDCRVIVLEMEYVNAEALTALEAAGKLVYPNASALGIIQNKHRQKCFFRDNDIPTAPFVHVESLATRSVASWLNGREEVVLKLCEAGYDGKGVCTLRSGGQIPDAFLRVPCLVEEYVSIARELALIAGRDLSGNVSFFPITEMFFRRDSHVLDYLLSPVSLPSEMEKKAQEIARKIMINLSFHGLLTVEFFLTKNEELLVNEVSPRVHNSGHHTIEANITSQYDQLLRMVCGYPMGRTDALWRACMLNVLGEDGHEGVPVYAGMEQLLAMDSTYLHLYGKSLTKPLRKMGHITLLAHEDSSLADRRRHAQEHFRVLAK